MTAHRRLSRQVTDENWTTRSLASEAPEDDTLDNGLRRFGKTFSQNRHGRWCGKSSSSVDPEDKVNRSGRRLSSMLCQRQRDATD